MIYATALLSRPAQVGMIRLRPDGFPKWQKQGEHIGVSEPALLKNKQLSKPSLSAPVAVQVPNSLSRHLHPEGSLLILYMLSTPKLIYVLLQ